MSGDGGNVSLGQKAPKNQGLLNRDRLVFCRRESQLLPLLDPAQGDMGAQLLKTQIARLTSFEDGLDDVGREECTIEDLSEVPLCHSSVES